MKKYEVHEHIMFHNVHFVEANSREEAEAIVQEGDSNYTQKVIESVVFEVEKIKKNVSDSDRAAFWAQRGYF